MLGLEWRTGFLDAVHDMSLCIFTCSSMGCCQVLSEVCSAASQFCLNSWVEKFWGEHLTFSLLYSEEHFPVLYFSKYKLEVMFGSAAGTTWHQSCCRTWVVRECWLSSLHCGCNFPVPGYNWGITLQFAECYWFGQKCCSSGTGSSAAEGGRQDLNSEEDLMAWVWVPFRKILLYG